MSRPAARTTWRSLGLWLVFVVAAAFGAVRPVAAASSTPIGATAIEGSLAGGDAPTPGHASRRRGDAERWHCASPTRRLEIPPAREVVLAAPPSRPRAAPSRRAWVRPLPRGPPHRDT